MVPLSGIFLIFYLGRGALASWDEAIYATVAKEAFQSGDWLNFTLQHTLWMDKPPLTIWATTFFYKLFGMTEFSARLFSALCGVGTVLVTYLLGLRLFGRWVGFCGALVLLSSSHFLRVARFGVMDAPLTFFLTLAFYFFWLARERNLWFIFMGISLGLAFMTKSFAIFPFFPIIFLHCLIAGELDILKRKLFWLSLLIAVLIALPWHLYQFLNHPDVFMNDTVAHHIFSRVSRAIEGHTGNAYFYIRTLVNKYHPWILIGVFSAPYFLFKTFKERESETVFVTVWMFTVLAVITLVRTKLAWYIVPAYPALSLSIGYFFAKIFKENQPNITRIIFIVIMILHVPYSHIFDHDYARDIKALAPLILSEVPDDQDLYFYSYHEIPALSFYADKRAAYLESPDEFQKQVKTGQPFFCLIREKDYPVAEELIKNREIRILGKEEGLYLISNKA